MPFRGVLLAALGLFALSTSAADAQAPLGTAFSYQGRLTDGGVPPAGPYDLRFNLYDAATAGTQIGPPVFRDDVSVTTGLFAVSLDFGAAAFTGGARWLEVAVRPGASAGAYTVLSPRQELTPSPSAVFSSTAPWAGVTGKPPGFADDLDNDTTYSAGAGLTLAGTVFSLAASGVTTANLADGSVTSAKVADGTLALADLGQNGCGPDQVLKWNGAAWACALDADAGGDITGVTAGTGLTGGAASGNATLGVSYGASGVATTAARSDHDHFSQAWSGAGAGAGLRVTNSGGGGILGVSSFPDGNGVHGRSTATTGAGWGVFGESPSPDGAGVSGYGTASSGAAIGVYGTTASPVGYGVHGVATSTTGLNYGIRGDSNSPDGAGVVGVANASSGANRGVIGLTSSANGIGVLGKTLAAGPNFGVIGANTSPDGIGVYGVSEPATGLNYGVYALTNSAAGRAVFGWATASSGTTYGLYGVTSSTDGYAGYFAGRVQVTGTLSKGAGSFKIDHPLDPENKYLYHSFVESPDMMNVYNGNAVIGADGSATVELPEWFEALNRGFRYQLTAIGGPGPNLHVAEEVHANRFRIAGGTAGLRVSWQVTGIRQDAFAAKHRIPLEEDKAENERGKYLHPEAYGLPAERGLDRERRPRLEEKP